MSEESQHESGCESHSDGGAAKKTSEQSNEKRNIPNVSRFTQESVIALCVGFVFLSFVFTFGGWLEGILEKAHMGSPVIFFVIFVIFAVGIACLGWVAYEWMGHPILVGVIGFILSVGFFIFLLEHKSVYVEESEGPSPPQQPPAPIQMIVATPDYVEGTHFTREQLDNIFPFGYAVIYLDQDGKKEIHDFHNNLLNWNVDWDSVKIEPDIGAGKVSWTIGEISIEGKNIHNYKIAALKFSSPFRMGISGWNLVHIDNNPTAYFAILSDNQYKPVFAIGFRIPPSSPPEAETPPRLITPKW